MRGTWQGSGTWQTSGPSLGRAAAVAAIVVAAVTAYSVASWVVLWWWLVLGVAVACVTTTAAVVLWLKRWSDRQATAVFAAREPLRVRAERVTELPPAERAAIENHYHVHYHAADGQQAPAITEGK